MILLAYQSHVDMFQSPTEFDGSFRSGQRARPSRQQYEFQSPTELIVRFDFITMRHSTLHLILFQSPTEFIVVSTQAEVMVTIRVAEFQSPTELIVRFDCDQA